MVETVKVSIYCNFDFQSFPFDDHECDLSLYDPINSRDWTTMASEYEVNDICYKNKNCKWLSEEGWLYLPDGSPYTIKMRYMVQITQMLMKIIMTQYQYQQSNFQ